MNLDQNECVAIVRAFKEYRLKKYGSSLDAMIAAWHRSEGAIMDLSQEDYAVVVRALNGYRVVLEVKLAWDYPEGSPDHAEAVAELDRIEGILSRCS